MAQSHALESNPGRGTREEVTIAVNLDGDHEGVHTCIRFIKMYIIYVSFSL